MDFSIELAKSFVDSAEEFPINFDDAWLWLGFANKASAKRRLANFLDGVDFSTKLLKSPNGRPSERIMLTVDCFKSLGMMAGTAKGKDVRKYFLDCERLLKQQNQQVSGKSQTPYWYQRLMLFLAQNKVPAGYFSIFQETITLVGDLETAGYVLPDNAIPDISIGKCWANYLRAESINPSDVAISYPHQYPGWAKPVDANAYPEELLPKFRKWFREAYKPTKLQNYLAGKDAAALPALSKMLGVPIGVLK